jgi:hypothetical protein
MHCTPATRGMCAARGTHNLLRNHRAKSDHTAMPTAKGVTVKLWAAVACQLSKSTDALLFAQAHSDSLYSSCRSHYKSTDVTGPIEVRGAGLRCVVATIYVVPVSK